MELKRPKNNKVLDEGNGTLFVQDNLERMYVVDRSVGGNGRSAVEPVRFRVIVRRHPAKVRRPAATSSRHAVGAGAGEPPSIGAGA